MLMQKLLLFQLNEAFFEPHRKTKGLEKQRFKSKK
jgi:hypothetical protein